jgi:hypothetical protein
MSTPRFSLLRSGVRRLLLALTGAFLATSVQAQIPLTLANPNWNITLTDFGYSDFLLDNTPGFEGREYLSGEWGAAVAYSVGGTAVGPLWLEPKFLFPDWDTNSDFTVISPITETGLNADNLPVAESVVGNAHLRVTLRFEMLDTVTGTPMGVTPATGAAAPRSFASNRYVLKQTATVQNISGAPITGLRFYQLLHGLSSQRGLYDDRAYAGALAEYRYDTTLSGLDPWSAAANTSSAGFEDFIGFHASQAPSGREVGYYGVEGNGVDAHGLGKPSEGVHLSVEDDWAHAPFAALQGRDWFEPPHRWVSGAQRWDLGALAPGQSASLDVLLSVLTGTQVAAGTGSSGSCNGGSGVTGGLDYEFAEVDAEGSCFGSFSRAEEDEIAIRVERGEFDALGFPTPGKPAQIWEVEFSGVFTGSVALTFAYDETLLPVGFDESSLVLFHFANGVWADSGAAVDPVSNTLVVSTPSLGVFALGVAGSVATHAVTSEVAPLAAGTVAGEGTFPAGTGVTLTATPEAGFAFVDWTEGGASVGASPTLAFNVTGPRALSAHFVALGEAKAITTFSLPANGGVTSGGGVYPLNGSATVVATPDAGFKFSKWLVNGVTVSTARTYTFPVAGPRELVAKFKPVYVVILVSEPADGGDTDVDRFYEMGELAKLKALPNKGYCFVNWTQNGVPVSTDETFEFNVTGNRELIANFAFGNRIDVAAEPKNAGEVDGGGVHASGATFTLTARANFGYIFTHWTETAGNDTVPAGLEPTLTATAGANRIFDAHFVALPSIAPEMAVAGDAIVFSWPAGADGWVLQERADLLAGDWADSVRPVAVVAGRKQVSLPVGGPTAFFRLVRP